MGKKMKFRVFSGIIMVNTLLIFITGFTIIIITWLSSQFTAKQLSTALMREITTSVSNKTTNYFEPAERASREIGYLVYQTILDPKSSENRLLDYFTEQLKINPEFKMVYFADTTGNLLMSRRMPDGTFSRRFVKNDGKTITVEWQHENIEYFGEFKNSTDPAADGYDPRKRPWYTAAAEKRNLAWTDVYIFATDKQPGFTCAFPLFTPEGELRGVCAVDIAVAELSLFLGALSPTKNAKLFIVDSRRNLVALQAKSAADLTDLFLSETDSSGNTVLNVLGMKDIKDQSIALTLAETGTVTNELRYLKFEGTVIQTLIAPLNTDRGLVLQIGVIIPEDDIIGVAKKNAFYVILFSLVMIIIALIFSVFLSRAIANPMRILSEEMGKIKDFVLDSEHVISTAIFEVDDMQKSFEGMKKGLKSFKRYVPADLVAQLIKHEEEANIGGEKRNLTVFFSDIAKFTSISEQMEPEKLIADLCEYFDVISKTILDNKGQVDKYIGDSVMAFWGAPEPLADHAKFACRAAIAARDNLSDLFKLWENNGKTRFSTRMGLHSGDVIVGNMGNTERINYTVIGDPVNVASRLEGLNKVYKTDIIISQATWESVTDDFEARMLDRVSVIGRKEGLTIYELCSKKDMLNKNSKKLNSLYEDGLKFYFEQNWAKALQHFATVLKYRPTDGPSSIMSARCKMYTRLPPPADWDGVFVQVIK